MGARQHDGSKIPRILGSCVSCLAWGIPYAQGTCRDCYNFCAPGLGHTVGRCPCGWDRHLKDGYCRLCWVQAREDRRACAGDARAQVVIAPHLPHVRFHQLFFAAMHSKPKAPPKAFPRRYGTKGRPLKDAPPPVLRPNLSWRQLPLFEHRIPRDYSRACYDLRRGQPPDNPWLEWALYLAHQIAERRGWQDVPRRAMQRVLVRMLAGHVDGDLVRASQAQPVAMRYFVNPDNLFEILQAIGILRDDRVRTFDRWLESKIAQLAPAIGEDVRQWALMLHDGGPRRRPRKPGTPVAYLQSALPALRQWSDAYHHLREVRADDITAYLAGLHGKDRSYTLSALRSLFGWAKRQKLIFRNPVARIRVDKPPDRIFQLLASADITAAVDAATTAQARVFVVLAAVHAARPCHIRAMQLGDMDLANRRLTITNVTRPMDELTHQVLAAWLAHRQDRWPNTANPHLMISPQTALGYGPVSETYLGPKMRGLPAGIDRLRINRQLEEAVASRADPLHLVEVFGVHEATAVKLANNARQLLESSIENGANVG